MNKQNLINLKKQVSPFERSNTKTSILQLVNTIPPFFVLWFLAYMSYSISLTLTTLFSVAASLFLVRIFILFHDCCHGSFFKNKKANDIVGTITGIMTMFPYSKWKREHSIHHATSGNLNKRGTGDIWIMTVDEYKQANWKLRWQYRLYRNPLIMFGLGPLYLLLVTNRINRKDARKNERLNLYFTNFMIVTIYAVMTYAIGWQPFLFIQGIIMFVAAMLGIWLFYVQHQFEDAYFEDEQQWDYVKAAIDGSSFYQLPKILQWVTGNIGYHHVHHLSPKVPNYYLETVHETTKPLQSATTYTLKSSLKALRFRLYDERAKTFISFKEAKKQIHDVNVNEPMKKVI